MRCATCSEELVDVRDISYDLRQLAGISSEDVMGIVGGMFDTGRFESSSEDDEY